MRSAIAITLIFVGATSALGAARSAAFARRNRAQAAGAVLAGAMAAWCWYCAGWLFLHAL